MKTLTIALFPKERPIKSVQFGENGFASPARRESMHWDGFQHRLDKGKPSNMTESVGFRANERGEAFFFEMEHSV